MAGPAEPIVIDANVAVALAVLLPWSTDAEARVAAWQNTHTRIYVPMLWEYEVVSTLRKLNVAGRLDQTAVEHGLELLLSMDVQRVEPDAGLHREALRWAGRLGQTAAYDAQYLAVASRIGAEFWTADQRLVDRARQCNATWVRFISET